MNEKAPEILPTMELPSILPEEQAEEYLVRITDLIYKEKYGGEATFIFEKGMNIHADPLYQEHLKLALQMVATASLQPKEKFSDEKNQQTLESIKKILTSAANVSMIKEEGRISFGHTNTERPFSGKTTKTDNIPYSHSLFGVGVDSHEAIEYLKGLVKNKVVYLLGGGNSVQDILHSEDLAPKQVVNIDPFIEVEPMSKGKNNNYISIGTNAEDPVSVRNELKKHQIEQADEIWASYSVPYYLSTPEEIAGLFDTIKQSLAENGIARITPIAMQGNDKELFEKSKEEFMNQIQSLLSSPEYNVYVTSSTAGSTLFIEKLPQKTHEE